MQKSHKLYALHLSFSELKELIEAEKQHSDMLKSRESDTTIADRVQKKATLLLAFTRQRYALCRAKESAAKLRMEYEDYTFSDDQEIEENGCLFTDD